MILNKKTSCEYFQRLQVKGPTMKRFEFCIKGRIAVNECFKNNVRICFSFTLILELNNIGFSQ